MQVASTISEFGVIPVAVSALFVLIFLYLIYSCGYLSNIEVTIQKSPFTQIDVAYKFTTGQHSECRQLISEVQKLAPHLDSFVIYHEDPREYAGSIRYPFGERGFFKPSHPRFSGQILSYTVGAIVRANKQNCNKQMCQILLHHGYYIASFPAIDNVIMATFPFVNQLSLVAAVMRVYPKMLTFIKSKRLCAYPVMELYTRDKIFFIAPLSQQNSFYVPDAVPQHFLSDSDSSSDEQVPVYRSQSKSIRQGIKNMKSSLGLRMFTKRCMCDMGDRSRSCDYCKRTL